jgi:hypothetical protein
MEVLSSYGFTVVVDKSEANKLQALAQNTKRAGVWGLGMDLTVGSAQSVLSAQKSGRCHDDGRLCEVAVSSLQMGSKPVQSATCIHAAIPARGEVAARNGCLDGAVFQVLLLQLFVPASITGSERDYLVMIGMVSFFQTTVKIGGTGSHVLVAARGKGGKGRAKGRDGDDDSGSSGDDVSSSSSSDMDDVNCSRRGKSKGQRKTKHTQRAGAGGKATKAAKNKEGAKTRTPRAGAGGKAAKAAKGTAAKGKGGKGGNTNRGNPSRKVLIQQDSQKANVSRNAISGAQAGIPLRMYAIYEHETLKEVKQSVSDAVKRLHEPDSCPPLLRGPTGKNREPVDKQDKREFQMYVWALIDVLFNRAMDEYAAVGAFGENDGHPLTLTDDWGLSPSDILGPRSPRFTQACRLTELALLARRILLEPGSSRIARETLAMRSRLFGENLSFNGSEGSANAGLFSEHSPCAVLLSSWRRMTNSDEPQIWVGLGLFYPMITGRIRQAARHSAGGLRVVEQHLKSAFIMHPIDPTCPSFPCKPVLDINDMVRERERERERDRERDRERETERERQRQRKAARETLTQRQRQK